jgi:hypothetical protein
MSSRLKLQGASVPEGALSLALEPGAASAACFCLGGSEY